MKQAPAQPSSPRSVRPALSPGSVRNGKQSPYLADRLWIDPFTNERVWVFNPMHIVNLSTQTKSKFIRIVEGFKAFSNKWFSHVLLLVFLILYGFLGAYIFMSIEAPIENTVKTSVTNMRERIINELWWSSQKFSKGWWVRLAKIRLKEFEKQLHQSCLAEHTTDSEMRVWTFWQALFFSTTIFTTIGYGHVVPKTDAGRVASILYAFIGIPLLLMVLTDLGKLFTRAIKFVFKAFRKLYYNRQMKKVRQAGRRATIVPQLMSQTFNAVNRKARMLSGEAENVSEHNATQRTSMTTDGDDETIPEFEVDDEFNLPISVAVTLLLAYMMAGAAVFTMWEKWTFFESFYFVYISLSTIGFGDYVPEHPAFMMATFIYLLFGLALTSMCINVVQEKLSSTFQKAKMRIGATMGLDITEMIEEEMQQDQFSLPGTSSRASLEQRLSAPSGSVHPKFLHDEGVGNVLKEKRQLKLKASLQKEAEDAKDGDEKKEQLKRPPRSKNVDFAKK